MPERLSDCGLTQVSPACAGSSERGAGDCRLHRLPQHNHLCLFAWRCDLAAPCACLYLNFEARIRGIQVVPGNAGAVHSV